MLINILKQLDTWISEENIKRSFDGLSSIRKCTIKILGQCALFEAKLNIILFQTMDLDAYLDASSEVKTKFNEILQEQGKHYDWFSNEIWMPKETKYINLFSSKNISAFYAEHEYVLLSKAIKDPLKNKNIITQYLSTGASKNFFKLCQKYKLDLEQFLK